MDIKLDCTMFKRNFAAVRRKIFRIKQRSLAAALGKIVLLARRDIIFGLPHRLSDALNGVGLLLKRHLVAWRGTFGLYHMYLDVLREIVLSVVPVRWFLDALGGAVLRFLGAVGEIDQPGKRFLDSLGGIGLRFQDARGGILLRFLSVVGGRNQLPNSWVIAELGRLFLDALGGIG